MVGVDAAGWAVTWEWWWGSKRLHLAPRHCGGELVVMVIENARPREFESEEGQGR